jgi:hypothetical protein
MIERLTERDLAVLASTKPYVVGLVAEVRRLRALIAAAGPNAVTSDGWCSSCGDTIFRGHEVACPSGALEAEADAIADEEKDLPSNVPSVAG